jgi:hypothetical protein
MPNIIVSKFWMIAIKKIISETALSIPEGSSVRSGLELLEKKIFMVIHTAEACQSKPSQQAATYSRTGALLLHLEWLNREIVDAREKVYLRQANKSHIKRLWPAFTEEETEAALNLFYNGDQCARERTIIIENVSNNKQLTDSHVC